MSLRDQVEAFAVRELAEVRKAPLALAIVVALGFFGGWWITKVFYAERMEVLKEQIAAARVASSPPALSPSAPAPPAVMLLPHVSRRVGMGIATGVAALFAAALVSARRNWRLLAEVAAKDKLLTAAARLHGQLIDERDKVRAELEDKKNEYAMKVSRQHTHLTFRRGTADVRPTVTVRFTGYGQDYELAQKIQGIFTQSVGWQVVLDGSNKPALPRADKFKVVFDVGMVGISYQELVHAFSEGNLLNASVGVQQLVDREDTEHLIVMVLPSAEVAAGASE